MPCFDYCMSHGCDSDCPVLLDGRCTIPEEVLEQLEHDFTQEELEDLKELYELKLKGYKSIW